MVRGRTTAPAGLVLGHEIVNATVIPLAEAVRSYKEVDAGVARKFVLDPHGMLKRYTSA